MEFYHSKRAKYHSRVLLQQFMRTSSIIIIIITLASVVIDLRGELKNSISLDYMTQHWAMILYLRNDWNKRSTQLKNFTRPLKIKKQKQKKPQSPPPKKKNKTKNKQTKNKQTSKQKILKKKPQKQRLCA